MTQLDKQRLRRIARLAAYVILPISLLALVGVYLAQPVEHDHAAQARESATVWTCSMHPQIKLPKPGLCPICHMDLIPLAESGVVGLRQFAASPEAVALMSIETAPVERKFVANEVRMVGKVDYDETRLAYITAWVGGRLDRLFVDYTGVPVKNGDHLVEIYSPELYSAQQELLGAIKAVQETSASGLAIVRQTAEATVKSAREKLRLWGLTPEQIAEIEKTGRPTDHVTIYAPVGGIVIHKNALQGDYVQTGTRIYTIADLTHVWVKLDAYESDLPWLRYGQKVQFESVSYPGETFEGTISFIDPVLSDKTRTVKVRVDVPNPAGKLKPEMFVKATVRSNIAAGGKVMDADLAGKWISPMHPNIVKDGPGTCDICGMPLVPAESLGFVASDATAEKPLVIPATAPLVTGTRAIVYVEVPTDAGKNRTFEGRQIVLGPKAGEYYIVAHGLAEGERVVIRGNFKIDSALQIQARPSMMTPDGGVGGGHDHGQMAGDNHEGQMPGMPDVPALARHQIAAVIAVGNAVPILPDNARDLAPLHKAYSELAKAVAAVKDDALIGDARAQWEELAMRLGNDAAEGGTVRTAADVARVRRSLDDNLAALQSRLGVMHHAGSATSQPAGDPQFAAELAKLIAAYSEMQIALSKDDFSAGQAAARQMQTALAAVDADRAGDGRGEKWTSHAESLRKNLADAVAAKDIQKLRETFSPLSEELISAARHFPLAGRRPLYVVKCPMAFNDKGARWLQRIPDVQNPYFGDAMFECGEVVEVVPPGQ